jgi:hypothetical protein
MSKSKFKVGLILAVTAFFLVVVEMVLVLPSSSSRGAFPSFAEGLGFLGASLVYILRSCLVVPLAFIVAAPGTFFGGMRFALLLTYTTPALVFVLHLLFDDRLQIWSRVSGGYMSGPGFLLELFRSN